MTEELLPINRVKEVTGFSRPYIYREMAAGRFPQPIRFSDKCSRWLMSDVQSWIAARIAECRDNQKEA